MSFLEHLKKYPVSLAIDYKKAQKKGEKLKDFEDESLEKISEDDIWYVWDFAVWYVLPDIIKSILHIRQNLPVFRVTKDTLDDLLITPFCFEYNRDIFPDLFSSAEEYEEHLYFSDDPDEAYIVFYSPSPYELYEMIDILSYRNCFTGFEKLSYNALEYVYHQVRCRDKHNTLIDSYNMQCWWEFRCLFLNHIWDRIKNARLFIEEKRRKTVMNIETIPNDILCSIINIMEEKSFGKNDKDIDFSYQMKKMYRFSYLRLMYHYKSSLIQPEPELYEERRKHLNLPPFSCDIIMFSNDIDDIDF